VRGVVASVDVTLAVLTISVAVGVISTVGAITMVVALPTAIIAFEQIMVPPLSKLHIPGGFNPSAAAS
jgi:hypothetical protein